jgi:hypothetical protein
LEETVELAMPVLVASLEAMAFAPFPALPVAVPPPAPPDALLVMLR